MLGSYLSSEDEGCYADTEFCDEDDHQEHGILQNKKIFVIITDRQTDI